MYDIENLERQWRKYRRKKMMPYWVGIGFIVLMGVVIYNRTYILKMFDTDIQSKRTHTKSQKKINTVSSPDYVLHRSIYKPAVDKEISQPSTVRKSPLDIKALNEDAVSIAQETKARKKIKIELTDMKSYRNVKMVEKRFKMTHDPDDGIFLARYYFDKKQYKKASYWALKVNQVDSTNEESWLIFAQVKAKTGQKKTAIKILKDYLELHDSPRARALLKKLLGYK